MITAAGYTNWVRRVNARSLVAHVKAATGLTVGRDFPRHSSRRLFDSFSMLRRNLGIRTIAPVVITGFPVDSRKWIRPIHRIFPFSGSIASVAKPRFPVSPPAILEKEVAKCLFHVREF